MQRFCARQFGRVVDDLCVTGDQDTPAFAERFIEMINVKDTRRSCRPAEAQPPSCCLALRLSRQSDGRAAD